VQIMIDAPWQIARRQAVVFVTVLVGLLAPAVHGAAQAPLDSLARAEAVELVTGMRDTNVIYSTEALHRLRRAPSDVRAEVLKLLVDALNQEPPVAPNRAMSWLREFGPSAIVALDRLLEIARGTNTNLRYGAIATLGVLGPSALQATDALRQIAAEPDDDGIHLAAATALLEVGDTSVARQAFRRALSSPEPWLRLQAAERLADLVDPSGLSVLRGALADTTFVTRQRAFSALGALGPHANAAIPDLTAMLADTVPRRIPTGGGTFELETNAAFAAWALSRIIPFRSSGGNGPVLDPLHVFIEESHSLRDDGLGVYAHGVDSVVAVGGGPLGLMLSGKAYRGPMGRVLPVFRRSLRVDVSAPVPGSGATALGIVEDNEANVQVWRARDDQGQLIGFAGLPPSDSAYSVARLEIHFRIRGVLHMLQMGPMVEGQGGGTAWYTGMHGDGTTAATALHPSPDVWIVRAPEGSVARLWSFEDRAHPIGRGLYSFSVGMRFMVLPRGAATPP
jgi:HEAT repeat protein